MDRAPSSNPHTGPRELAGMRVVEELGRGARAVVYRVERQGRPYALKLHRELDGVDQEAAALEFRREAAALACARHPGLLEVHEVGEVDGRPYLVMELLAGRRLSDLLADGPLPIDLLLDVGAQLGDALAAAHAQGLVHRDVKPDNVMLIEDRAKLIDFGLAVQATCTPSDGELVAGTMLYCAPEQSGMLNRPVDARSDLYALGAVLYECATGRPPFQADDVGELLRLHAVATPDRVVAERPEVPDALGALIAKLLAKDPDDRYQTASAVATGLRRIRTGETGADPCGASSEDDRGSMTHAIPLVGRDAELGTLVGAWRQAKLGAGSVVLVEGAPGSGRSRLVYELVRAAEDDGAAVMRSACDREDPVPFSALGAALDGYLRALAARPAAESASALDALRRAAGHDAAILGFLSAGLAAALGVESVDPAPAARIPTALAGFLLTLSRSIGGLAIVLDDAQWLDDATQGVLRLLAGEARTAPLLVVGATLQRPDDADDPLRDAVAAGLTTLVRLEPLPDESMERLLSSALGDADLDESLLDTLLVRSNGSPLAAFEFLHAIVDSGSLRPSWGRCLVDRDDLDRLSLPDDVMSLVVARIDLLGAEARTLLTAAAAIGSRFVPTVAAEVVGTDLTTASRALDEAVRARLLESAGPDELRFVHDSVREQLLAACSDAEIRRLHQDIAASLERRDDESREAVYALAHHYALGDHTVAPERVFATCRAAGRAALAELAAAEALDYLEHALEVAPLAGAAIDAAFEADLARACLLLGLVDEGEEHFRRAIALEPEPWNRARYRADLARHDQSVFLVDEALEQVDTAFAEISRRWPRSPVLLVLLSLRDLVRALACRYLRLGSGSANGEQRRRFETLLRLHDTGGQCAYVREQRLRMLAHAFRSLYPANRVGPSADSLRVYCSIMAMMGVLHLRRVGTRMMQRNEQRARDLGDGHVVARVAMYRAMTLDLLGDARVAGDELVALLRDRATWLETGDLLDATGIAAWNLRVRGYHREAAGVVERAASRIRSAQGGEQHLDALVLAEMISGAACGRGAHSRDRLDEATERIMSGVDVIQRQAHLADLVELSLEQGDLEGFDDAVTRFEREGAAPRQASQYTRQFWIAKATGRLAQLEADPGAETRRAARRALRELRKAANVPLLRAHSLLAQATLARIEGHDRRALKLLGRAEHLARHADAPLVRFGVLHERARVLQAQGLRPDARREAALAAWLANEHEWTPRVRAIRSEFALEPSSRATTNQRSTSATNTSGSASRERRQLRALLDVNVAASTVVDPQDLAPVALDEIVRILGAERAMLFMCQEGTDALELYCARDADGHDLGEAPDYSTTLVEHVRSTGEPLVVTGTDEGAALGSRSVVVHGLRSIVIAPLQLEGRLLGVVYLDSRLAKGIFTEDDVAILNAIASHIAVSMETARAAQLEVAMQAERRQRALAEDLRDALAEVATSLDPNEVLQRVLVTVGRTVAHDAAVVMLRDGDRLCCAAASGDVGAPADQRGVSTDDPPVRALLDAMGPVVVPDTRSGETAPFPALAWARSWTSLPLRTRDHAAGVLVLASRSLRTPDPTQAEIAAAFAAQGFVAFENARLFATVERLASIDALTGVDNRRRWFELAAHELAAARRHGHDLAAIMLDIDHFKQVNDTHGHAVGDGVLRTIAERLREALRTEDLLGRYGGEEFAVVLRETGAEALEVAERLRAHVASAPIPVGDLELQVTISVGVAVLEPDDTSIEALIVRADHALYDAKHGGRDRVCTAFAA